ncbi:hypothetical protein B296_00018807 [Ensete ventricosum]|uniref:Uncharacterized protein n=1 Tax=Ensete ventricosum TaxID=4639 RepID=A0A426YRR7_ENSVE|nr:hypothetical protein B296_00018807 [Ensete ventricosum]
MASTFVDAGGEGKEQQQQHHHHHDPVCHQKQRGAPSPRTLRRTRSSVSSTVAKVTPAAALECVCAPTTHAGSFKCRLHRVSSHGRSTASFIACPKHQPPTIRKLYASVLSDGPEFLQGLYKDIWQKCPVEALCKLAVLTAELYCPISTPAGLKTVIF